ncbi:MAG: DUF1684 domain-containing protein [Acidobacteria bacterium]|nr:DUF1684 domain-containing protein [Acidobacteriota bacterium]
MRIRASDRGLRTAGFAICLLVLLATVGACGGRPVDPDADYIRTLQAERARKDAAFLSAENSPIPANARATYLPLKYFAPDPAYAVPASFAPALVRTPVTMPTSTGKLRDMEQVGSLEFTLAGRALSLAAFVEAGTPPDRLFIPFSDLTSGTETYSAGRYLEIDLSKTGIYIVDFNRAFNPYCYYNHEYDCPYPPKQNRLPIPIHAGEKMAQSAIPAR